MGVRETSINSTLLLRDVEFGTCSAGECRTWLYCAIALYSVP